MGTVMAGAIAGARQYVRAHRRQTVIVLASNTLVRYRRTDAALTRHRGATCGLTCGFSQCGIAPAIAEGIGRRGSHSTTTPLLPTRGGLSKSGEDVESIHQAVTRELPWMAADAAGVGGGR